MMKKQSILCHTLANPCDPIHSSRNACNATFFTHSYIAYTAIHHTLSYIAYYVRNYHR